MIRPMRRCLTSSLCWTRYASPATSDAYSVFAATHDHGRCFPLTPSEMSLPPRLCKFWCCSHYPTLTVPRSCIHCQSFEKLHNFIAHLRLYLDAYIRNACFIAHTCTCIPQLLAVLRNQYIIPIHIFHDMLSQKEGAGILSTSYFSLEVMPCGAFSFSKNIA
jgi:hypothetical protein